MRGRSLRASRRNTNTSPRRKNCKLQLPQLPSMQRVGGAEEKLVAQHGQRLRPGTGDAGVDVLNQICAAAGAVALPQFDSVRAVVGGEEERVAGGRGVGC